MPCRSEHQEPNTRELESRKVRCRPCGTPGMRDDDRPVDGPRRAVRTATAETIDGLIQACMVAGGWAMITSLDWTETRIDSHKGEVMTVIRGEDEA